MEYIDYQNKNAVKASDVLCHENNDRLGRFIFEQAPVGLIALDNLGIIRNINLTASCILGGEIKYIKGRKFVSFVLDVDRDKLSKYLVNCRYAQKPDPEGFLLIRGINKSLKLRIKPFPHIRQKPGQHPLRMMLLDRCDSYAFEHERQLSERLHELDLHDQRRNLFLAMLSHELRNPLGAICNAAEVFRRKGGEDPALLLWSYRVIRNQTNHLSGILRDLLDISRITLGKIVLNKETVIAQTLVDCAIETHRALLDEHQNHLSIHTPSFPVWLDVDPTRCVQIIGNLIHNAVKFSDSGGDIQLTVDKQPGWGIVRVRDFGCGIPVERLSQVFELFYQTNELSDGLKGGLGIGLALAKQLTELHGGHIDVTSDGVARG
ncbi:MAG: sensor histidine kinase, partial [Methylococcaceae bacterium]